MIGSEPSVVASLLKQFLRELPDPVLTHRLGSKAEEVAKLKSYAERRDGLKSLLGELPECNRMLVQWIFVHMGHVIANEKTNKMTLQNVSIVLSPTMQISPRVFNCIFENHSFLFKEVSLLKYIPPISGRGGTNQQLPESPEAIAVEMRKQESLLAELHQEISSGVSISKAREEQLWEQQRIVTQLKRNLRSAKTRESTKVATEPEQELDMEEELNFNLQTPAPLEIPSTKEQENLPSKGLTSSPEDSSQLEHKVTVQIHREMEVTSGDLRNVNKVTVIQVNKETEEDGKISSTESCLPQLQQPAPVTVSASDPEFKGAKETSDETPIQLQKEPLLSETALEAPETNQNDDVHLKEETSYKTKETVSKEESSQVPDSSSPKLQQPQQVVSFSSSISTARTSIPSSNIPLLPPPPPSNKMKTSSRGCSRALMLPETRTKSKSLPRGLPSERLFEQFEESDNAKEEDTHSKNNLLLEEMRLRFELDELLTLKGELEIRRRTERREVAELQEEIATMQTLYQYRTYSVDSSEESSEEEEKERSREHRNVKLQLLARLAEEKKDLEGKKMKLQAKLQEERAVCLQLRVDIRMEQERIKKQKGISY